MLGYVINSLLVPLAHLDEIIHCCIQSRSQLELVILVSLNVDDYLLSLVL